MEYFPIDCHSNSEKVKNYGKISSGTLVIGLGEEDKWCGMHNYKAEGQWNMEADVTVENFKDSGNPMFRGTSALNRGRFTSLQNLRMSSCYFAQVTQQIS